MKRHVSILYLVLLVAVLLGSIFPTPELAAVSAHFYAGYEAVLESLARACSVSASDGSFRVIANIVLIIGLLTTTVFSVILALGM